MLKALQVYGKQNFTKEILEICESREQADEREIFWISHYNAVENENFYNLANGPTIGNSFEFCHKYWQEHPQEFQENIKKWNAAGHKYWQNNPEEHKKSIEKMLEASRTYWQTHPEEQQQHMQKVNQAKEEWQKQHPEEYQAQVERWRQAGSIANSKRVRCLTTGEEFESVSAAARFYNIPQSNISKCLKGERHSAGKHPQTGAKMLWMFIE